MKIYLMQHGEAEDKNTNPERNLTDRGRLDVTRVANFLVNTGLTIPEIWHSEKNRARQTAEIVARK